MLEMDESDWRALNSSPKSSNASFVAEDFESNPPPRKPMKVEKLDGEDYASEIAAKVVELGKGELGSSSDAPPAGSSGGSIAERRAAKFGFNAARISTPRFRTTSPLASPAAAPSPRLSIPPGISPTALLDSPIMLPNTRAQPSPTTGTYSLPPLSPVNSKLNPVPSAGVENKSSTVGSSFRFKPQGTPVMLPRFAGENQIFDTSVDYQTLHSSTDFEFQAEFSKGVHAKDEAIGLPIVKISNDRLLDSESIPLQPCHSDIPSDQIVQQNEPVYVDIQNQNTLEGEPKEAYPPSGMGRSLEDGYNWRKYGQKQVKGSEFPRSYYKCTHPTCQVKKKVERSLDGQITEIIYKGAHNHPKPRLSRPSAIESGFPSIEMIEIGEGESYVKADVWSGWRGVGLERTSSTSVLTELSDPFSTTERKTPELSSTLASHDKEEDRTTEGSISQNDDADDDESDSKRRKKESYLIETDLSSRALREPRIVVQIESKVDILDDGYRWRKYGQKVVKGNPNPRSYYKCTSAGCTVRKHVERASHNLKSVITTYEGKHNHEVPAAKNSCQANSIGANLSSAEPNAHTNFPKNVRVPKPEPNIQDFLPHLERKPELSKEFLRPGFLGNFGSDMNFGASSIYQMRFPPLQNTLHYDSFGPSTSHNEVNQMQSLAHFPDIRMSLPISVPHAADFGLAGFDFSNHRKPVGPVRQLIAGQQLNEGDSKFINPKQEVNAEGLRAACLPVADHANTLTSSSSSSSVYCQLMGGYP